MLVQNLLMDIQTQILSTGWKFYSRHYVLAPIITEHYVKFSLVH
jgi:hypothetical protein